MLGGDVGELGGEGGELARGAEAAVEVGAGAAVVVDDAADDEVALAAYTGGLELGEEAVGAAHVEEGFDLGLARAGAHLLGRGAAAEDEGEGADDDRLAGAGLTGEDVEAALEGELELLHQNEVLDPKGDQHGGRSIGAFAPIVDGRSTDRDDG